MKKSTANVSRLFIAVMMTAIALPAHAQSTESQIVPPGLQSPTAASLGKFGNLPVSLYTGVPDITIPLHEAAGSRLTLPIQLRYHASGIKVREIAGWTGLGWSLDAGGVITRTVQGLVDESSYGYLNTRDSLITVLENSSKTIEMLQFIEDHGVDTEPDIFYYNFAGRSGKFLLTTENMSSDTIYALPVSDTGMHMKYIRTQEPGGSAGFKFEVTVEDGTTFVFDEPELVTEQAGPSEYGRQRSGSYISSWYLTRVESAEGDDLIDLTYGIESEEYEILQDVSGTAINTMVCSGELPEELNETGNMFPYYHKIIRQPYLETIQTQKESIHFVSDENRNDPGRRRLTDIEIIRGDSLLREFEFGYGYNNETAQDETGRRLLLEQVTEKAKNGVENPPYAFDYDPAPLPDRLSLGVDYWGYYNGRDNNTTLIPAYEDLPGADREPSFPDMRAGSLTRINWPAGGSTEFIYGPHMYSRIGNHQQTGRLLAGGLRIAEMIDIPGTGADPVVRRFDYTMPDDSLLSSGVLVSRPVHYYSGDVDLVVDTAWDAAYGSCSVEYRSSSSTVPLGSTRGSHIGYQYVTTVFGENAEGGSIQSEFVTAWYAPDRFPDGGPEKPGRRSSSDWRRGIQTEEQVFGQNGNLLASTDSDFDYILLTDRESPTLPTYPVFYYIKFTHPPVNQSFDTPLNLYLISEVRVDRGVPLKTDETGRLYDPQNEAVYTEHSTEYTYHEDPEQLSFGQLKEITEINSDGAQRITGYTYVHEVTDDGTGVDYTPMRTLNMLSQPHSITITDATGEVLSKRWTLWGDDDGFWRPRSEWIWTGGNPDAPAFEETN